MGGASYLDLNRASWDDRAPAHYASPDYAVERAIADPHRISDVVAFDAERLGDITGLRGVHLQCHIGTDTLSLHRLGARMSGLDLSPVSVEHARRLAEAAGADIRYVVADVNDALEHLPAAGFDLVYTGIGALCWLPSIDRWAEVVTGLLAPGGRLFLREGHPMLWACDEPRDDGVLALEHPYFERPEPTIWEDDQTYVKTDMPLAMLPSAEWNHGLGEVVTALLDRGMRLTQLIEHDTVPWVALPGAMEPHPDLPGEFRLVERPERLPMSYTLQAVAAR